jgi:hypothetical protein
MRTSKEFLSALLVTAALLLPGGAHAVRYDAGGTGQALIYPYYTVRSASGSAYNTYITVTNQRTDAKVLRVRFREGRSGAEVAGFNLYLGPEDSWAGVLVPTDAGTRLLTSDKSCRNGSFVDTNGGAALDFTDVGYSGGNSDGLGTGLERTREGYVEIIEMATLTGASAQSAGFFNFDPPTNCAPLQGNSVALETAAPSGGISGALTLINVASGIEFSVTGDALGELRTAAVYR